MRRTRAKLLAAGRCDAVTAQEDREPLSSAVKRLEGEVGPHAHHPLLHLPVFEQLKRRNVFRVAVLYLVVCWLILDPLHVVFHMLDVPVWANRLVLMLMAVGFPAVVTFAWVYEITPEGLKPTVEVPHHQSIRKLTGRRLDRAIIAALAVALAYFVVDKFWISKHVQTPRPAGSAAQETASRSTPAPSSPAVFTPPPHSVAVLPFVNLSGDASQDYFSEGLTEELLNSLAQINNLQVAARTSSFSFKEHPDIGTVARKLNVAAVLEGSVRRSAHTVRVTAQLINTVTGFHLWSKTYDRDLGDVLKLQTEIATAVAGALQVTLLGDEAAKIELGGTRNAAAYDAYLRASKAYFAAANARDSQDAITGYTDAIRLDPNYALAYAARSLAFGSFAKNYATGPDAVRANFDKAELDARKAIALAPDLGLGHLALASVFERLLDFRLAKEEYDRALELDPGSARTLSNRGFFAVLMGHTDMGLTAQRRAVTLDPLNSTYYGGLGASLFFAGLGDEAMAVYRSGQRVDPDDADLNADIGILEYVRGNFESARTTCENRGGSQIDLSLVCLAITYDKLGRRGDAEASLAKLKSARGDAAASMYARIYAQWGNRTRALDWLEMAMRLRDPWLVNVKTSPLLDPLRKEPRFQAIERQLKFPD